MISLALALVAGALALLYVRARKSGLFSDDSEDRLGLLLASSLPAPSAHPASPARVAVLVAGAITIDAEAVRAAVVKRWGGVVTLSPRGPLAFALGTGRAVITFETADAPLERPGLPAHGGVISIGDVRGSAPEEERERFVAAAVAVLLELTPAIGCFDHRSGEFSPATSGPALGA